jgi:hypothetical protein
VHTNLALLGLGRLRPRLWLVILRLCSSTRRRPRRACCVCGCVCGCVLAGRLLLLQLLLFGVLHAYCCS